ncbi:MAG: metal-dependent hydrolase [Halioglobus sp.]|jgi:predicted metal-dependent hydrolase|nr:metal-dependent hydrolase [Halioglobus sp.]
MPDVSFTPIDVPVQPRNREHDVARALAGDWFDNHPFKTAWFNAMSITFPLGEKFFIDSVRHYSDQITDPKMNEDIRGFCGQEGFHRREHQRYNESLCRQRGYDLDLMECRLEKNIQRGYKYMSPLQCLASTAALEHITAILAESALSDDDPMIGNADNAMQALWQWHAAEEMEHKAVAFDVFKAVGGTEKMRKRAMLQGSFFLILDVMMGLVHMLRKDKKLWSARIWYEGCKFLFFKGGILRRVWPAYKEYYRNGFHPWDRDTRTLLHSWQLKDAVAVPA